MKLKDLFENEEQHPGFLTDPEKIKEWLDDREVTNYTILPDGKVDVEGNVKLYNMSYILVQFNKVTGNFRAVGSTVQSLKGSPHTVNGTYVCTRTSIKNLEGAPRKVGGHFWGFSCPYLQSLKGGPKHVEQGFSCESNSSLTSLDYAPLYVGDDFECDSKFTQEDIPFTTLKGKFKAHANE